MKTASTETATYARMGMAALLPGMQYMLEQMQAQLDHFRSELAGLQGRRKIGRPRKEQQQAPGRSGWPEDPQERKKEMARRMAMRKPKMHPRDPKHPGHAEWVAKAGAAAKRRWKSMTPAQRKARVAAMNQGRRKKEQAVLAVAS